MEQAYLPDHLILSLWINTTMVTKITPQIPQYSIFDPCSSWMNCHILYGFFPNFSPFQPSQILTHFHGFGFFWNTSSFLGFLGGHLISFSETTIWHLGAGNVANRCLTRPSAHVDFWPWDDGWDSWWSFDWRWTGAASQLSKLPNYSLLGGEPINLWWFANEDWWKNEPNEKKQTLNKKNGEFKCELFGEGSVFRGQIEVPDTIWNYKCMWYTYIHKSIYIYINQ